MSKTRSKTKPTPRPRRTPGLRQVDDHGGDPRKSQRFKRESDGGLVVMKRGSLCKRDVEDRLAAQSPPAYKTYRTFAELLKAKADLPQGLTVFFDRLRGERLIGREKDPIDLVFRAGPAPQDQELLRTTLNIFAIERLQRLGFRKLV